jgi:hypothetical protein
VFNQQYKKLIAVAIASILTLFLGTTPALATTFSFKTEGIAKRDGILKGQLVFDDAALQKAIREMPSEQGVAESIPLSKIEGAKFSFKYISPYSKAEHSELTLCSKEVSDISGFEKEPLVGANEPNLVLSGGQPEFIDFNSCIGQEGSVSSQISELDPGITSSSADAMFGKLSVFDKDVMGNMVYKKIQPIKFELKS